MKQSVLDNYQINAATFAGRFEKVSSARLFSHVQHYLPTAPSNILDIGAGTGRDAAWFASQGHRVTAVEPVDALREFGIAKHGAGIAWLKDHLPDLLETKAMDHRFDHIHLIAVWHHLTTDEQVAAMGTVSQLMAANGKLILSIKHAADDTQDHVPHTLAEAQRRGLKVLFHTTAEAVQPENRRAGVKWTWLVLGKGEQNCI